MLITLLINVTHALRATIQHIADLLTGNKSSLYSPALINKIAASNGETTGKYFVYKTYKVLT